MQSALPLAAASLRELRLMGLAGPATVTQFCIVLVAFVALVVAFVGNDFSVAYVANNSNLQLPLGYRITPRWGGARRVEQ